jgi:inorganic pyrophosphatase
MSDSPRNPAVEVLIEIPRGSRNKYEMDKKRGFIKLDRRLFTATVYPADYGYILDTHGEDGDPLDALVLLEDPTFPGCVVDAVPVGLLWMQDEKGPDAKVICVPTQEPRWEGASDLRDLPEQLLEEIKHFFSIYKDLEPDKHAITQGFEGRKAAWKEIEAARVRYQELPKEY